MVDRPVSLATLAEVLRGAGVSAEIRSEGGASAGSISGSAAAGATRVTGASQDSRSVSPGHLFLAWKGTHHDSHDFVADAARRGAAAAIVEHPVGASLPQIVVDDARRAAAVAAHFLAGEPTRTLRVAAVTGTNGKTTTTEILRHLLSARWPAASIGTLGVTDSAGIVHATEGLTTPGPVEISRALARLVDEGVRAVSLEASSHALDQRRLDGLRVEAAAFTNLTRDHLDYHPSASAYLDAKARLLLLVREDGGVVVNGRDPAWAGLPPIRVRLVVCRMENERADGTPECRGERLPDLVAEDVRLTGEGSRFRVRWGGEDAAVSLPLLGRFNVENALAALAAALLMGMSLDEASVRLAGASPPTGRLELAARVPVPILLDYAHTPDALARVLETLRPLYSGRVILVFGAGGDRDRAKRPEMGKAALRGADVVIVTSDNPRTEDPDSIIDDIVAGMGRSGFERITDRREAIARAIDLARPGDAVLLAGKGHETYQIVGTEHRPFDERAVVREILEERAA